MPFTALLGTSDSYLANVKVGRGATLAASKKPFLERYPQAEDRRLARGLDKLSSIINALIRRGQLVQVGPEDWRIVP